MRKGFGLITAILFIVLVATIGALALSFSSQASKQTTDTYLKAQAELLAYSATEFALLALAGHARNTNCLNEIHITDVMGGFDIDIYMQYIGRRVTDGGLIPDADCVMLADGADNNATAITPASDVTVLMDTIVELPRNALGNTEPIRIHRRTLQKP